MTKDAALAVTILVVLYVYRQFQNPAAPAAGQTPASTQYTSGGGRLRQSGGGTTVYTTGDPIGSFTDPWAFPDAWNGNPLQYGGRQQHVL